MYVCVFISLLHQEEPHVFTVQQQPEVGYVNKSI